MLLSTFVPMLWRCLSWLDLTKSSKIQGSSKSVSKVESRLYIDSEDIRTSGGFNKLVDIVHGDYVISSLKYWVDKVQNKNNTKLEFITNPNFLRDDAIPYLVIWYPVTSKSWIPELLGLSTIWTSITWQQWGQELLGLTQMETRTTWIDKNGKQNYLVRHHWGPELFSLTTTGTRTALFDNYGSKATWFDKDGDYNFLVWQQWIQNNLVCQERVLEILGLTTTGTRTTWFENNWD